MKKLLLFATLALLLAVSTSLAETLNLPFVSWMNPMTDTMPDASQHPEADTAALRLQTLAALPFEPTAVAMENIDGAWYLHELGRGESMDSAMDAGVSGIVVFQSDGTMIVDANDNVSEGWWFAEDALIVASVNEELAVFAFDGEALWTVGDAVTMIFRREQPGLGYTPADVTQVQSIADFNGVWSAELVELSGTMAHVDSMYNQLEVLFGMRAKTIAIENGAVCLFGREPETFVLSDGRLIREGMMTGQTICLHEDGSLSYEAMGMTFYCEAMQTAVHASADDAAREAGMLTYADHLERKYLSHSEISAGLPYGVCFHADGTAELTLAGVEVSGLAWHEEDGMWVLAYFTTNINFTPTETGFDMDYFGSWTLPLEVEAE